MTLIDIFNKAMEEIELRQNVKDIETFYINNSLIVYTPGTNSTQNVEDRTMTNEIQKVRVELNDLQEAMSKEARRYSNRVFLTATVFPKRVAIDWSADHDVVKAQIEESDREMERFAQGRTIGEVVVNIVGDKDLKFTSELEKEIRKFKNEIADKYARPMADLREKIHLLNEKHRAESELERLENKKKGANPCTGCGFCDDDEDLFFL